MKKTPASYLSALSVRARSHRETWHNGGDIEICLYARSLRNTARTVVSKLELDRTFRKDFDACPAVLLYRQSLEIHLKLLVGEGGNFLKNRTDPISLSTTRSLRWLAQIVCQIIRTLGWESDFTCEGVSSLADFSAMVREVESFDPVARAIRSSGTGENPDLVSQYYRTFDIAQFAKKLDALLDLLDVTADALAAASDHDADPFKPTIQ